MKCKKWRETERERDRKRQGREFNYFFVSIKNVDLLHTLLTWQLVPQIINEERAVPHHIPNHAHFYLAE